MRTSRAANATTKENIAAMLADKIASKKQSRAKNLAEYTREKAEAKRKIEALQAEQDNADTPGAYKMNAEQIHEQEDYIRFLEKRAHIERTTPLISKEEYKEIERTINAENERILDECSPAIIKKYNELMELMNEYTAQADSLQDVLNQAQEAHFNRKIGGHLWHNLKKRNMDEFGYFEKFCQGYFDRKTLIDEVKLDPRKVNTFSNPEYAGIFAALHRKKQEATA